MNGPDDIERRLREIEAELGRARVKEPSAAGRARQAAQKTGRRNARKARKLRKPVTEPGRRPPGRGRVRSVVVVVVLACVAGATVAIIRLAAHPPKPPAAGNTPVTNGPTPSSRPTPTGAPGAAFLPSPTLTAPFLGTPAQSYADGAAGIVIPPAHAVGSYSAAQVTAAYRETKRLLVAANLNLPTLRGGSPDAFANLLIPMQRSFFVARLDQMAGPHGIVRSTRIWVTSFAPGTTKLVGNVIKVHGNLQATTGKNGSYGTLRIIGDYLFVYAVERPGQPSTLMRIVVRYVVDVDFARYDDPGGALEPWWSPDVAIAGARCDINDGFVHPDFPNGPPDKVRPTGAPVNPYSQSEPLPAGGADCGATTGT